MGCKHPTPGEYFSSARTTSIATVALERSQAFSTAEGCKQPWCEPHSASKALGTDVEGISAEIPLRGYVGRSRGRGAGAEQVEERRQMKAEGRDRGREAEDKRTFFTSASFLTPS